MNAILKKRSDLIKKLKSEEFDVLIIGTGITGAGIAWDASLRGLKVAIIDKIDFGAGTSSGSSKLVHAGIRYLAYGEFSLVRHASRERMWIFKHCPHITAPIPFIIPVYKGGKNSTIKMIFAGIMYDLLSFYKNTKIHKFLNKSKTINLVPNIKKDVLKHSLYYWDGVMDDARVTLETVLAAEEAGTVCLNHCEAVEFLSILNENKETVISGIVAKDYISNEKFEIKAKVVINAAGPWTDKVLAKLDFTKKLLYPTKGIHIITKRIVKEDVVVVITADDGRGMFVIPFRDNYSLIGTTDTHYPNNLNHIDVTQEDISYVVKAVNNDLPGTITEADVISAYSGVRPLLISPKAKAETDTSRGFDIFETHHNLFTITGGKYTIFRYMAEKMVDRIVQKLGLQGKQYKCSTKSKFLHGGNIKNIKDYIEENTEAISKIYKLENDIAKHLVKTYGTAHEEILKLIKKNKSLKERIGLGRPHIIAEIHHAILNEHCLSLSDFMLRRTQLQLIDNQGLDCAEKVANEMGKLLDWDETEIKSQYTNYKKDLMWVP